MKERHCEKERTREGEFEREKGGERKSVT